MRAMEPKLPDPRNEKIWIHVGGELLPREQAKVSVFDSSVQGGDAVWEGLRVYGGRVFALEQHLERLETSARALAFERIPPRAEIRRALFETLAKNGMRDGAHVRLTLTRGKKVTSGMSPAFNQYGTTLIVLAEWKAPVYGSGGLTLISSAVRRAPPAVLDSKIHHNNLLHNILAKIEANIAGVEEAVMLNSEGFVAECTGDNIFGIRSATKTIFTPSTNAGLLNGVTRRFVLETLAPALGYRTEERLFRMDELLKADEVFLTGSAAEIIGVSQIDTHVVGRGAVGPHTKALVAEFRKRVANNAPED